MFKIYADRCVEAAVRSTFAVHDPCISTKRTLRAERPFFWCVVIPVRKWEECFPKQSDKLWLSRSDEAKSH